VNTQNGGLLDKAGGGEYRINTVGENLVAMALPVSKQKSKPKRKSIKTKKKPRTKKVVHRK